MTRINFTRRIVFAPFLVGILSCGGRCSPDVQERAEPAAGAAVASSNAQALPVAPLQEAEKLTMRRTTNHLANGLAAHAAASPGNFVVSPTSLAVALAMTALGARGVTQDEMLRTLGITDANDLLALGHAARALSAGSTNTTLRLANRIFLDQQTGMHPVFRSEAETHFSTMPEVLDIAGAPTAARMHINAWVAATTENRIAALLPENAIRADTRMVLINALYFAARWATPFLPAVAAPFHLQPGESVPVETMRVVHRFRTATVDGADIVELPYVDGRFVMTLVLPRPEHPTEPWLTADNLQALQVATRGENLDVWLPKFRIAPDTTALREMLERLGMHLAFSPTEADFSGLALNGDRPPSIAQVFHRAFIAVDEEGTEAAAATAVLMREGAAGRGDAPRVVRFDRPFLFFLCDRNTQAILFSGRVVDPRLGEP